MSEENVASTDQPQVEQTETTTAQAESTEPKQLSDQELSQIKTSLCTKLQEAHTGYLNVLNTIPAIAMLRDEAYKHYHGALLWMRDAVLQLPAAAFSPPVAAAPQTTTANDPVAPETTEATPAA